MKVFKKEKEVADLALHYVDIATRCVSSGREAVLAYLGGDLDEADAQRKETSDLESKADALRGEVGDILFSGAYLPSIRADIFAVIETLDKVPNASEACAAFFLGEKPDVPPDYRAAFSEVTNQSFGGMVPLRRLVKTFFKPKGGMEKIRERVREVGTRETEVDGLEWELTLSIFQNDALDLSRKVHLKTALSRIAHLSDVAENAADRVQLAAMKAVL